MITIDHESAIAIIEITGVPTVLDIHASFEALLGHPDHVDGMDEIWDFRGALLTSLKANELRALAIYVGENLPRLSKRTALVLGGDVNYGIGRMWGVYADDKAPKERKLFRHMEEALEWLAPSAGPRTDI